jgi:branched-chain amino acid transport system substrate-binding protein
MARLCNVLVTVTSQQETSMQRRTLVALPRWPPPLASRPPPSAQSGEIRIAHVYSKTGPLEAYGKQTRPA